MLVLTFHLFFFLILSKLTQLSLYHSSTSCSASAGTQAAGERTQHFQSRQHTAGLGCDGHRALSGRSGPALVPAAHPWKRCPVPRRARQPSGCHWARSSGAARLAGSHIAWQQVRSNTSGRENVTRQGPFISRDTVFLSAPASGCQGRQKPALPPVSPISRVCHLPGQACHQRIALTENSIT